MNKSYLWIELGKQTPTITLKKIIRKNKKWDLEKAKELAKKVQHIFKDVDLSKI